MSTSLSAPNVPVEDNTLWVLKSRREELGSMFKTVWDNYIKFYTVFLTFSLGAMGWLLTYREDNSKRPIHHVIAIAFILQSLLTAITSASLAKYSSSVSKEQLDTEKNILGYEPKLDIFSRSSIPKKLGIWAGVANCIAMIAMIGVWLYVGFCKVVLSSLTPVH